MASGIDKHVQLTAMHDYNEVLFYRVVCDHMRETFPIICDPVIGEAIRKYSLIYRRPRGIYLSIDRADEIELAFENLGLEGDDVDIVACSDAEEILGIGDWGVGGVDITIGKLAVYTAAAGLDPARNIPVGLDVGTDRQELLDDPFYTGNRHKRVRGDRYDAFIGRFVSVVRQRFPKAFLHWEDFGPSNGRRLIEKYRGDFCTFNDDMQGTGAITLAGVLSGCRATGVPITEQTVIVYGTGTAGAGIADQIRNAMLCPGLGLGIVTSRARLVTDGMVAAAARAVSELSDVSHPGAPLLPMVTDLHHVSATVAAKVIGQAISDGVAQAQIDDIEAAVQAAMWQPEYPKLQIG